MICIAICCPPAFGHILPSLQLASKLISSDRLKAEGLRITLFTQLAENDVHKIPTTPAGVEVKLLRRGAIKKSADNFEDYAENDTYGEYARLATAYYEEIDAEPNYIINGQLITWGGQLAAKFPRAKLWSFHASPLNVLPVCIVELFPSASASAASGDNQDRESKLAPIGAYSRPLHKCCCSFELHTDPEVAYTCPAVGPLVYDDMPLMPAKNTTAYKMFRESFRIIRDDCEVILCNDVLGFYPSPLVAETTWQNRLFARAHAVGPLCKVDSRRDHTDENIFPRKPSSAEDAVRRFLDAQEVESVIFVGLGSWCDLSDHDIHELTEALAASGRPVLWAYRGRAAQTSNHYIAAPANAGTFKFDEKTSLPIGWVERMGSKLLLLNWVNQIQVLGHPAVGCFVSHCGWNSLVESIVYGPLPVVALPIAAEQAINAKLIADVYYAGMRAKEHVQDPLRADRLLHCINEVTSKSRFKINAARLHKVALAAENNSLDHLFNDI